MMFELSAPLRTLLILLLPTIAMIAAPVPVDTQGSLLLFGAALSVLLSTAFTLHRDLLPSFVLSTVGPAADERCRRGVFRRQSNPDTPGRPRPRAPGHGLRLA